MKRPKKIQSRNNKNSLKVETVATPKTESKPLTSYSTVRHYDEEDLKNNSKLMANKFRNASILSNYKKICSNKDSKNITKTLLGLQKQKKSAMDLRNLMDEEKMETKSTKPSRMNLKNISKTSGIDLGYSTTMSCYSKGSKTDSK